MAVSRHKLYADGVFLFHIVFIIYFIWGAFFSLHHLVFAYFQCFLVIGTVFLPRFIGGCPLTLWELHHRRLHNPDHFFRGNSFYSHYVFGKLFNIDLPMWGIDTILFVTKVVPNFIPFLVVFGVLGTK